MYCSRLDLDFHIIIFIHIICNLRDSMSFCNQTFSSTLCSSHKPITVVVCIMIFIYYIPCNPWFHLSNPHPLKWMFLHVFLDAFLFYRQLFVSSAIDLYFRKRRKIAYFLISNLIVLTLVYYFAVWFDFSDCETWKLIEKKKHSSFYLGKLELQDC